MMQEEQERILRMVEEGQISAEEAGELLSALGGEEGISAAEGAPAAAIDQPLEPLEKPWEVPFFGGLIVALLGTFGLWRRRGRGGILAIGAWGTVLFGMVVAAAGFWSRDVPWLHLRVEEKDGDKISLSFPLPLFLANWFLGMARSYVDEDTAAHLDSASGFIEALRTEQQVEPFSIRVDEGDGDRVHIYIA
jgi:hypothetical protein